MPKVWGGRRLDAMLGAPLEPVDEPIGETWEVYDRPDGSSAIRGGGTLRDLMEQDARGVLGPDVEPGPRGSFPLLLKLIDAQDRLSVQVHTFNLSGSPLPGHPETPLAVGPRHGKCKLRRRPRHRWRFLKRTAAAAERRPSPGRPRRRTTGSPPRFRNFRVSRTNLLLSDTHASPSFSI